MSKPRIEIEYCRQCGFLPRAARIAPDRHFGHKR